MLGAWATPRKRAMTVVFLAVCCICAIGAVLVGIADNPPGILLAYSGATALVLAFVHPWRTARPFRRLLYASVVGLVVFAILHNAFEAAATRAAGVGMLQGLLQGLSVVAFLLAVLLCPPGVVVGGVGSVIMFVRNRDRPAQGREGVA